MHYAAKISLGTLVAVGAVAAYYHHAQRRALVTAANKPAAAAAAHRRRSSSPGTVAGGEAKQSQRDAGQDTQWQKFTDRLAAANLSVLSTISLGNVLPDWSIGLPDWITRLQSELNMEPGSLADAIWTEARDPAASPEVARDARVRLGAGLCDSELRFLRRRREFTRRALARYLGLPEHDVHADDVPVIAATGSGGGLRAAVAGAGYYSALHACGLFDCLTYTAGVSGSCWLQTLFLSSIGRQSFDAVVAHLKARTRVHLAYPPRALELLDSPPTNKYLLRGIVEKLCVGYSPFGLVDLYGLLLGARLMVPADETSLDDRDLKLSCQSRFLDAGEQPLPIFSAVRHEIPATATATATDPAADQTEQRYRNGPGMGAVDLGLASKQAGADEESKPQTDWFQWFEATPYEFYSEDLEAGIPAWGLGRRYENGINVDRRVPEMKLPLLLGIWGSAFCATLSHYYAEIRPFVTSLSMLRTLDNMVLQRNDVLTKVHVFDPASVPNFVKGLEDKLPPTCPESLLESETIQLMDSGMSNNLGCYPLLRKGRNVDIVIAFDSSSDIKVANWIGYVEGYAKQRRIKGWPVSIGWPQSGDAEQARRELEAAQASSSGEAAAKLEEARHSAGAGPPQASLKSTLGPCTVWVGSLESRESQDEPPPAKAVEGEEEEWHLLRPDSGIVVAYLPLITHPAVPGVDPDTSAYLSTWNFEWTPEQIDNLIALAKANFGEGADQLKRTVRAVYERKRKQRLDRLEAEEVREHDENERQHRKHMDQFS